MLSAMPLSPWSIHQRLTKRICVTLQVKARTEDTITHHSELCFKQDITGTTSRVTFIWIQNFHGLLHPYKWLYMGVSGFFSILVVARVAINTVSILCPDVNPDCEASRKLALVCCWHFLITVFLIILPRNEMAIADIYRDNVSFLRSGKITFFSKSLIGESLWLRHWLFPSLAGKLLLHCY